MPPREWTPMALLAQLHVYYRRENGWPTLRELAVFTELPVEQVQRLVDILVDRRYVRVEGETIYPWEAGPSPVVTYRLSPEEIAARYGPAKRYKNRTAALQAAAAELVGCWPERHERTSKEGEIMPKGTPIQWPPDEELLAMANEIRSRGGDVVGELSARFGCSPLTLKKQLGLARRAVLRAAPKEVGGDAAATSEGEPDPANGPTAAQADEEATETMPQYVNWPDPHTLVRMADELTAEGRSAAAVIAARLGVHPGTVRKKLHEARQALAATPARDEAGPSSEATAGEPGPGEAPSSGELMQMAEEEASRIIETTVAAPEPRSVDQGTATLPEEETASSGPQDAPAVDDLDTFHALILVGSGWPEYMPTARQVMVHCTEAPEQEGDEWAEQIRDSSGRKTYRIWTCCGTVQLGGHTAYVMVGPAVPHHRIA